MARNLRSSGVTIVGDLDVTSSAAVQPEPGVLEPAVVSADAAARFWVGLAREALAIEHERQAHEEALAARSADASWRLFRRRGTG
jgi:hypothetical protein